MANYTNTEEMYYDLEKHRYILTEDDIVNKYGIQLTSILDSDSDSNPDTIGERFLNRTSLILYNYIYSWSSDKNATEFVISLPQYRDAIQEAMEELVYGWINNNTDPSIFFQQNPLECIKLVPSAHTILLNNGLLYRGKYMNLPKDYLDTKGEDY